MAVSSHREDLFILIALFFFIAIGTAQRGGDEFRSLDLSPIFNLTAVLISMPTISKIKY
jgi:hypothetical protein